MTEATRTIRSVDGTAIAVFASGAGPPLVLVHGAAADHTTFRVVGPRLVEAGWGVHAIDRRGRGASGDTLPYAIEREFEDVAAVVEALAAEADGPVDVVGHSYGGRCALGAALRTDAIRRVVSYEGAPTPPGVQYSDEAVMAELTALDADGDHDAFLERFMRGIVGMDDAAIAAYRADPVWPARVRAAPTILRELRSEESAAVADLDALGQVRQPVLQVLGGDSIPAFVESTTALDERLADGRVVVIPGARHSAHHTHPAELVAAITAFVAPGV